MRWAWSSAYGLFVSVGRAPHRSPRATRATECDYPRGKRDADCASSRTQGSKEGEKQRRSSIPAQAPPLPPSKPATSCGWKQSLQSVWPEASPCEVRQPRHGPQGGGGHTDTTSRSQSHRRITRRDRFAAQRNAAEVAGRCPQITEPDHRRAAKHSSRPAFPCSCGRSKSKRHRGIAQCVGAGATGESGGMPGSSASPRRRTHAHARAPARTIQPEMEGNEGRERAAHARPEGKKRGQQREGREADEAHAKSRLPRRRKPSGAGRR